MILFRVPKLMDQTFKHPIIVLEPSPSGESGPKKSLTSFRVAWRRESSMYSSVTLLLLNLRRGLLPDQVDHVYRDILHFLSFFLSSSLTFRLFVFLESTNGCLQLSIPTFQDLKFSMSIYFRLQKAYKRSILDFASLATRRLRLRLSPASTGKHACRVYHLSCGHFADQRRLYLE